MLDDSVTIGRNFDRGLDDVGGEISAYPPNSGDSGDMYANPCLDICFLPHLFK